ncbi:MAG: DUF3592 domain-containing protein [Fimbriiglobus sp.]|nr:DUF3592 domain-containing protein [Fimbriiglobus sp.]
MSRPSSAAKKAGACFLVPFLLFWSAITLSFDAIIAWGVARQCWAWTFAQAPGTILSSEVKTRRDSDGDNSHRLAVTYRYTVDGREFIGDRYRYGMMGTNDKTWQRVKAQLPPGTAVTVYHDPANPAEATLTRGPQGSDLFIGNFLVPFNLVGVGLLAYLIRRNRTAFDPDDPKQVRQTPIGWRLKLGARDGWMGFAFGWGAVAFVSVFVIAFTVGFNPPVPIALIPWVVGLGLGAWAFIITRRSVQVAADEVNRELTIRGKVVPFDRVKGFEVIEREVKSEDESSSYHYKCVAKFTDDDGTVAKQEVYEFHEREDAERLADWLGAKVRS